MNSKYIRESQTDSSASHGSNDPVLIQQALGEVLASPPFRSTRQCQDLLRYVVDNTLAGLDHLLRERVIGAEVFGRKPDYDTSEDPVVRLRAAEVRKRLAQYYLGADGATRVRIEIPSGSYRATFDWASRAESPVPLSVATPQAASPMSIAISVDPAPASIQHTIEAQHATPKRPLRFWIAMVAILVIGAGIAARVIESRTDQAYRQFWAPMVRGPKAVLICMGSNAVYRLSNQYLNQYLADTHEQATNGYDFFPALAPDKLIEAHNLEKAYNSFVALGDVAAVSDIVADLTRQGKPFKQRFPPDISFAELESTPTITIGGFNNPLTLTLTKDLRFVLAEGSRIEDQQDKTKTWSMKSNGDSHDTEDYAVISRMVNAKTSGPVIAIAGIGQYGTQAAAEYIGNPEAIAALAKTLPKGWSEKNVQVVLHIHIVNYRPITTEVVATHSW